MAGLAEGGRTSSGASSSLRGVVNGSLRVVVLILGSGGGGRGRRRGGDDFTLVGATDDATAESDAPLACVGSFDGGGGVTARCGAADVDASSKHSMPAALWSMSSIALNCTFLGGGDGMRGGEFFTFPSSGPARRSSHALPAGPCSAFFLQNCPGERNSKSWSSGPVTSSSVKVFALGNPSGGGGVALVLGRFGHSASKISLVLLFPVDVVGLPRAIIASKASALTPLWWCCCCRDAKCEYTNACRHTVKAT